MSERDYDANPLIVAFNEALLSDADEGTAALRIQIEETKNCGGYVCLNPEIAEGLKRLCDHILEGPEHPTTTEPI